MYEFIVNKFRVTHYLKKHSINQPEDFLIFQSGDVSNAYILYTLELDEDWIDVNELKIELPKLLKKFKLEFTEHDLTDLLFKVFYLAYFYNEGVYYNKQIRDSNRNLLSLIKVAKLLKEEKEVTEFSLHFNGFKRTEISSGTKIKGNESIDVGFNTLSMPAYLTTDHYLKSLSKFLHFNLHDDNIKLITNPTTSINQLEELAKLYGGNNIDNTDSLILIYTALLLEYFTSEFNVIQKAKVISVQQAKIIYDILIMMRLVTNPKDEAVKANAIDNFRKNITRNLYRHIKE